MVSCTFEVYVVGDDPNIPVWNVVLRDDDRKEWRETYGSLEAVNAFVKGVEAACNLCGVEFVLLQSAQEVARQQFGS